MMDQDQLTFSRKPDPLLEDFNTFINEVVEQNIPVIVEGKNDKRALETFGIKKISTLSKPLFEIVEQVKGKEVVILTDLDKKGKELYKKFHSSFTQRGVKVNNDLRHFLMNQTPLAHIEGLPTYIIGLEKKDHIIGRLPQ